MNQSNQHPLFSNADVKTTVVLSIVKEYPVEWIERHLEKAGLNVVSSTKFPIMYSHAAIVRQLNVARSKLPLFPSQALAIEMADAIDVLEDKSKAAMNRSPNGRLRLGFDYVVTAEKPDE